MSKRFVVIWFRHLKTDWMSYKDPSLKNIPFILALPQHGKICITEVSALAKASGLHAGMVVADARVIIPTLKVINDHLGLAEKLLKKIALWCIRFTPVTAIEGDDCLVLDVSGCTYLWGSEEAYLRDIVSRLKNFGWHVRAAMADTIGVAWAVCKYGKVKAIIKSGEQQSAIEDLPPAALRLETDIVDKLHKLGLYTIGDFISFDRTALRRRFTEQLLLRMDQALGYKEEYIQPVIPLEAYLERLPCLQLIQTRTGIEIAIKNLLHSLCTRLKKEGKGLRDAILHCYRIDNKIKKINIKTNHPSNNVSHLLKLFELKIETIEPGPGIELFLLEAPVVEKTNVLQELLWTANSGLESREIAELLDNLENKYVGSIINRYLPDEHYMPERSVKQASSLQEKPQTAWPISKSRPLQLLSFPERIAVTAPIPDYPPMNFRYKEKLHKVIKADVCERIEAEWWLEPGLHRDYYIVEDEEGKRYWIFRLGHYTDDEKPAWFMHGFFA